MLDCVTREVVVQVDLDRAWAALTEPAQVARWFGDAAEIDLRVGGAVRFGWPAGEVSKGVVTTVEPRATFAYRWDVFGTVVEPAIFTHVEFRLRAVEGGTAVRVLETGLHALASAGVAPDLDELFEEHVDGWRNEMTDLFDYLHTGQVAPPPLTLAATDADPAAASGVPPVTGPAPSSRPAMDLSSPASELPA